MPPKPAPPASPQKKEDSRKEEIKIEEPKKNEPPKIPTATEIKEEPPKSPRSPKSPKNSQSEQQQEVNDEASKKKKQAEMFKKYLDQTGIAMAFQVIFAEILDKKIEEGKLFAYTAMRLRQIGEDLEKIKISKK